MDEMEVFEVLEIKKASDAGLKIRSPNITDLHIL